MRQTGDWASSQTVKKDRKETGASQTGSGAAHDLPTQLLSHSEATLETRAKRGRYEANRANDHRLRPPRTFRRILAERTHPLRLQLICPGRENAQSLEEKEEAAFWYENGPALKPTDTGSHPFYREDRNDS